MKPAACVRARTRVCQWTNERTTKKSARGSGTQGVSSRLQKLSATTPLSAFHFPLSTAPSPLRSPLRSSHSPLPTRLTAHTSTVYDPSNDVTNIKRLPRVHWDDPAKLALHCVCVCVYVHVRKWASMRMWHTRTHSYTLTLTHTLTHRWQSFLFIIYIHLVFKIIIIYSMLLRLSF